MAKRKVTYYQKPKNNGYHIQHHRQQAVLKKVTNNNVAEIYACFCKVLIEEGNSPEDVVNLFAKTQECWNELVANESIADMVRWCEEITNITLSTGYSYES